MIHGEHNDCGRDYSVNESTTYDTTVTAEQDDLRVRGNAINSGDLDEDKEYEDEILARLDRGDVWAWAHVTVTVECPECGASGSDSLGACSYESESDFRDDAYFHDMLNAASEECKSMCTCRKPVGSDNIVSCT